MSSRFFCRNPLGPPKIKNISKNGQTGSKRAPLGGARTYGGMSFSKMLVM
jgi:hypothetical protein